jgi:hypothetical protein
MRTNHEAGRDVPDRVLPHYLPSNRPHAFAKLEAAS